MQNKWIINILLVIIMILVVIACVVTYMCLTNDVEIIEPKIENLFSQENYPKVDGLTVTLPLAQAFKAEFTGIDINDIEIEHSNNNNAYINLINGSTDLILVTYPTEEEKKLATSQGIELEIVPVVKDAFVFMVNKNNPIDNITLNQLQNIYSGKIKNWKDIGGGDSAILAFQKPENSQSHNGLLKYIMNGNKLINPITENVCIDEQNIIDVILDYDNRENALGYSYYYFATKTYTDNNIKLLSVNGIKPTYENIQTGLYQMQTTYYAIIRKDEIENSNTRKLLNAMVSENGQIVAKEAGYVQNY